MKPCLNKSDLFLKNEKLKPRFYYQLREIKPGECPLNVFNSILGLIIKKNIHPRNPKYQPIAKLIRQYLRYFNSLVECEEKILLEWPLTLEMCNKYYDKLTEEEHALNIKRKISLLIDMIEPQSYRTYQSQIEEDFTLAWSLAKDEFYEKSNFQNQLIRNLPKYPLLTYLFKVYPGSEQRTQIQYGKRFEDLYFSLHPQSKINILTKEEREAVKRQNLKKTEHVFENTEFYDIDKVREINSTKKMSDQILDLIKLKDIFVMSPEFKTQNFFQFKGVFIYRIIDAETRKSRIKTMSEMIYKQSCYQQPIPGTKLSLDEISDLKEIFGFTVYLSKVNQYLRSINELDIDDEPSEERMDNYIFFTTGIRPDRKTPTNVITPLDRLQEQFSILLQQQRGNDSKIK